MKKVVTILFLIFILSCSSGSQNLETENIYLKQLLDNLEAEYLSLETEYLTLETGNIYLKQLLDNLEAEYLTLETEYRLLEMSINNLRKQYESSDIESSIKSKE
jgi:hypothetical protein